MKKIKTKILQTNTKSQLENKINNVIEEIQKLDGFKLIGIYHSEVKNFWYESWSATVTYEYN